MIDGTGAATKDDQTPNIRNGLIEAVGTPAIPEGATVVDLTGHFVLPGLVGMHDHMYYPAPRVNAAAFTPGKQPDLHAVNAGVSLARR